MQMIMSLTMSGACVCHLPTCYKLHHHLEILIAPNTACLAVCCNLKKNMKQIRIARLQVKPYTGNALCSHLRGFGVKPVVCNALFVSAHVSILSQVALSVADKTQYFKTYCRFSPVEMSILWFEHQCIQCIQVV